MPALAVRVQEKGKVTIPLEIRRRLRLKKGDLVTFVETEQGYLLLPAEVAVGQVLEAVGKVLKEKGSLTSS
jgi:AbrB family looped-hinge helix DNA binding protein